MDQSSDGEFQSQIITLDELDSMMEAEQLRAAEGGKRLRALWELRREERERKLWS